MRTDITSLRAVILRLFLSAVILAVVCMAARGRAQSQTLADGDWFERQLGSGVVWRYYLFDRLYGQPQAISYVEADLSNPNVSVEFPYLANARQRISTMVPAQAPQARAALNGSYFATTGSGGHVTYLRINGTPIPPGGDLFSPWGYEGAIAISAAGNTTISKMPAGGWQNATQPDILACGPVVLFNNVVPAADLTSIGSHCTARHPRSAVGVTNNNKLILFVVDGRTEFSAGMTCAEVGIAMKELGCDDALNLDGGGSTTLWGAGEPYSGVLNFPSDNGAFDHLGERACSNAISVVSSAAAPAQWDAQLTEKTLDVALENGMAQSVTLKYKNIGTGTWTSADTAVVLSRPDSRSSVFRHASWISSAQPAVMTPAIVAPGQTATFTFTLQAPVLPHSAVFNEHFMLRKTGVGRIGPADSEAWMRVTVQLDVNANTDFVVEARPGGQNWTWYSDSGMADSSVNGSAPGLTAGIGSRWGSTYRTVAGAKVATVAPEFPQDDFYRVYASWPNGSSRRNPITYHVDHPSGSSSYQVNQETESPNAWRQLGTAPFFFEGGRSGTVRMTNENINESGSMYISGIKFEHVPTPMPDKSYTVRYLAPTATKPVINGTLAPGEWDAAAPAASGFVQHDNPAITATEDGNFRMLFDDTYLYMQFTMQNATLPSYPVPGTSYGYANLSGDKVGFFLTPGGVKRQKFYRLLLSPNPTNGSCYVWSQASPVKTTDANVGTDWSQRGGAAYTYNGSQLVMEYKIAWANFNYPGMAVTSRPADGETWGLQTSLSNNKGANNWEYVNWEPDSVGSFVLGEPYGELKFEVPQTRVDEWMLY